jgi:murein hydrolase activator
MNRVSSLLVMMILTLTVMISHAAEKPTKSSPSQTDSAKPKEKLTEIHQKIESLKKELSTTQEAHSDATDALKKSEQAISESSRKLFELQQKQNETNKKLAELQKQKINLQSTIESQKKLIAEQVYRQYTQGDLNDLQIILGEKDPLSTDRQMTYFNYVSRARTKLIESTKSNLNQVAELDKKTSGALQEIMELKSKEQAEHQNLEKQKAAHKKIADQLALKITSQRGEIEKLKRDEKSLSDLMDRLARASTLKQAIPPTPKNKNKPSEEPNSAPPQMLGRNETLPSSSFGNVRFEELRGKLNLPVRGDITNRFGTPRSDTGLTWKGIFIRANEGSEIKAIANGRVVFADWMRGFGNLMIIDHGDGYMSLYGNNEALLRHVGEAIKTGDTIASVGNSGGNPTSGLYFELRKQSVPIDPMSWSSAR